MAEIRMCFGFYRFNTDAALYKHKIEIRKMLLTHHIRFPLINEIRTF